MPTAGISGVSKTIAQCIQTKYNGWVELVENCTLEDLQNMKYSCKTGKERRIGKVVSSRVCGLLKKI